MTPGKQKLNMSPNELIVLVIMSVIMLMVGVIAWGHNQIIESRISCVDLSMTSAWFDVESKYTCHIPKTAQK